MDALRTSPCVKSRVDMESYVAGSVNTHTAFCARTPYLVSHSVNCSLYTTLSRIILYCYVDVLLFKVITAFLSVS